MLNFVSPVKLERLLEHMRTLLEEIGEESADTKTDVLWYEKKILKLEHLQQRKERAFTELARVVEQINTEYKDATKRLARDKRRSRNNQSPSAAGDGVLVEKRVYRKFSG